MSTPGTYLYGFTASHFNLDSNLRGLSDAAVRLLCFRDVAAVVSNHPVQKLVPMRKNLEPHHRVVRQISLQNTLIPAAFGHIAETEEQILNLIRENYDEICEELSTLAGKVELGIKLRWTAENIFAYFIKTDRELRELRDRVFRDREPSLDEKLKVGSLFEARLNAERERLCSIVWTTLGAAICDKRINPPRDEKIICNAALLIERARAHEFGLALQATASLLNSNFALEYSGPFPPYSFVNLRLQPAENSQELEVSHVSN